jgi:hypothetical protein
MRDTSSGQRTVKVCAEAETVTGPGRTPEMSAGTMAATLTMGMKSIRHRISFDSKRLHINPRGTIDHRLHESATMFTGITNDEKTLPRSASYFVRDEPAQSRRANV